MSTQLTLVGMWIENSSPHVAFMMHIHYLSSLSSFLTGMAFRSLTLLKTYYLFIECILHDNPCESPHLPDETNLWTFPLLNSFPNPSKLNVPALIYKDTNSMSWQFSYNIGRVARIFRR